MIQSVTGNNRLICFLVFCYSMLTCPQLIAAQIGDLTFKHLTTDDGLSQSTVTCILQDSRGFMWFGTQHGLNRYDGYSFTNYYDAPHDTNSILGSFIYRIIEDRKGNLWIGTESGLNIYNRFTDKFVQYRYDAGDADGFSDTEVRAVLEDSEGNIWFGTVGGGLHCFDAGRKKLVRYRHEANNPASLSSDDVYCIYQDPGGSLWVGSMHGDVDVLEADCDTFRHIYYKGAKLSNDQIWSITGDSQGNIWVCTYRSGLYMIKPGGSDNPEITRFIHDDTDKNSISGNFIFTVFEDSRGRIWIGTENRGLNLFNRNDGSFMHFTSDPFNSRSLNNNSIWSIYEDSTGNLWIGTHAGGINLMPKYGGYFDLFRHYPGNDKGLSHNSVTCFCEDSNGNLWIGTDGGGLNMYDSRNGTFRHYNTGNSNLGSETVLSVFQDSRGNLWVGTWEGGLNLLKRGSDRFITFTEENSGLCSNTIFSIIEDSRGVLWTGSFYGGLSSFDRERGLFTNYTPDNSSISDDQIRMILEDSNGDIWACGATGLNLFHTGTGSFTVYRHQEDNNRSLSKGYVKSIQETADSTLWVGTTSGLNRFDRKQKGFTHYYVSDGLPDNDIKGIEEDNHGNLWLSTNRGLARLNLETGIIKNYDVSDGLQGNEFYQCSAYRSRDGKLYFGGVNGFNVFRPDDIVSNPCVPPVVLTDFRIFNKPVEIGENFPLQAYISEVSEITLSYRQKEFSFGFAALNYISSEKNRYSYILEGYDAGWNLAGTRHTATYTNIDPGEYTFRVMGSNNDQVWNREGASVRLVITPPFWQTLWFKTMAVLVLAGTVVFIYWQRVRQVLKRNIELETLVKQRTKEINDKNRILTEQTEELKVQRDELDTSNSVKDKLFSVLSHDLRSPFNTLKGFTELIRAKYNEYSDEDRKKMIGIISDSADQTYSLLDNLLNWSRSQRGTLRFTPRRTDIIRLIDEKIKLLTYLADNKNISIELECTPEQVELDIDPDLISVVIQNLLTNAIKFSFPGGKIKVTCSCEGDHVVISVSDQGTGISEENIGKLFRKDLHFTSRGTESESGTGLGLLICRDFIELHHGRIWLESQVNKGSTFSISLPASPS